MGFLSWLFERGDNDQPGAAVKGDDEYVRARLTGQNLRYEGEELDQFVADVLARGNIHGLEKSLEYVQVRDRRSFSGRRPLTPEEKERILVKAAMESPALRDRASEDQVRQALTKGRGPAGVSDGDVSCVLGTVRGNRSPEPGWMGLSQYQPPQPPEAEQPRALEHDRTGFINYRS